MLQHLSYPSRWLYQRGRGKITKNTELKYNQCYQLPDYLPVRLPERKDKLANYLSFPPLKDFVGQEDCGDFWTSKFDCGLLTIDMESNRKLTSFFYLISTLFISTTRVSFWASNLALIDKINFNFS